MRLSDIKHIHFTGIKGVGMTALALCAQDMGMRITGSDTDEVFVTDEVLARRQIAWTIGFGAKNLKDKPDLLVATAAHGGLLNPEVKLARQKGIPVLTYAELLAEFAKSKELVSVCGVGGKTTTSSMIATLLDTAKLDPSYAIGVGSIFPLGVAGKFVKSGRNFVCEADDYAISPGVNDKPKFSLLNPKVLVATNLDYDHPDVYKTFDDMLDTFKDFFAKVPKFGVLVSCIDNPNLKHLISQIDVPVITYGFGDDADWQVKKFDFKDEKTHFDLYCRGTKKTYREITLNVPGKFNIQNATATFIVGNFLGIGEDIVKAGLLRFLGTRRRFENAARVAGVRYFDDYAHHPDEIKATLEAARDWFPKKRIITVFQPHTFSRTKALFNEFAQAFSQADIVGFMDIYASARESADRSVSSKLLADETSRFHNDIHYLGNHEKTLQWLQKTVKAGDIVLTMGAGDIFHLYNKLN